MAEQKDLFPFVRIKSFIKKKHLFPFFCSPKSSANAERQGKVVVSILTAELI